MMISPAYEIRASQYKVHTIDMKVEYEKYNKYIDYVIARFLIEEGYEIDTIARILYDR